MPEITKKSRFFEFGPYRLDRDAHVLLRDEVIVPLTPKVFETLAVLVDCPGEVVSKETLMQRVWPDTFVEESNIAQNVSVLRKALGDAAYIETVPKRGYRFVVPAGMTSAEKSSDSGQETVGIAQSRRGPWALVAFVAAAGLLLVPGVILLGRSGQGLRVPGTVVHGAIERDCLDGGGARF